MRRSKGGMSKDGLRKPTRGTRIRTPMAGTRIKRGGKHKR